MTTRTDTASPMRFGVIGLGRAGASMLPALSAHPYSTVVAAADLRPAARERFTRDFDARAYESAAALCVDPNVDAVYIATPHQFHAEHCILAASHGKHMVVEKPLALTLEDCDAILQAVERYGVKLIVGHTASYNPGIRSMREIIASGELGKLGLINIAAYTPFLYRPRRPEELDTAKGGGIVFNQVPHQVDSARLLGGGLVRSVRAVTGVWDAARPTEGAYAALLQFADGAAATLVYSGYDHFDTTEFRIATTDEQSRPLSSHGETRQALRAARSPAAEVQLLHAMGYGGSRMRPARGGGDMFQPELGLTIVSCERGDMRLVADGLIIYDEAGKRAVPLPLGRGTPGRGEVIDELYEAVVHDRPLVHHGRWGRATLEVCLAILQSSREGREVTLSQQCPVHDWEVKPC